MAIVLEERVEKEQKPNSKCSPNCFKAKVELVEQLFGKRVVYLDRNGKGRSV